MRVHTADHSTHHRHDHPFHSLSGQGLAHTTGTADRDQPSRSYRLNRRLTALPGCAIPTASSLPAGYGRSGRGVQHQPPSSMRMIRMFGASSGSRGVAGRGLYIDSCIVRPATLPDGGEGHGKIVPSTSRSPSIAIAENPSLSVPRLHGHPSSRPTDADRTGANHGVVRS
jgi:hypothetical protein